MGLPPSADRAVLFTTAISGQSSSCNATLRTDGSSDRQISYAPYNTAPGIRWPRPGSVALITNPVQGRMILHHLLKIGGTLPGLDAASLNCAKLLSRCGPQEAARIRWIDRVRLGRRHSLYGGACASFGRSYAFVE